MCGSVAEVDCVVTWALLPRMAMIAGPPPLVGKCRSFKGPAALARQARGGCEAPCCPAALALVSTTTGCFRIGSMPVANGRVTRSLMPPGGKALMIVMARVG